MQACQIQLCTLRPEIVNLEVKDQLAMILACKIADAEAYRKCEAKHDALAKWINKDTTSSLVHRRKIWRV